MKILSLLTFICIILNFPVNSQWEEQVSPTTNPLYAVSVVNNSTAWICGRYGTVLRTTDGGANWSIVGSGYFQGYVNLFSVFALDDQTAFVAYHQGGIGDNTELFKTTDGGQNWSAVFQQTGGWIMDIKMYTENTGFLYTSPLNTYWRFFNTSDGGSSWASLSQFPEQISVEFGHYNSTFTSGSQIFFGSNSGYIYHSTDSGYNWSLIPTVQTNSYSVWFNNSSDGIVGEDNTLEVTTDGGSNWSLLTSLNGLDSISAITGVGTDWWVANQNTVYYSDDNRVSWTTQYTTTSGKYTHMAKARNGNLIISVRNNGGISAYLTPVPVELASFTAKDVNENVILNWETVSETNNSGFVVQRLENIGSAWEEIGFVEGKGTSTEDNFYEFIDKNVEHGFYSYRLIQLNFDGKRTESGVVNVEVNPQITEYSLKQNYPNPFNSATTIKYSIPKSGFVTIKIFNSTGEEIKKLVNKYKSTGSYTINFDASGLPSGIYFYRIESNKFKSFKR